MYTAAISRRPLDPRKVNVIIDANALDPRGGDGKEVDRLLALSAAGKVILIAPRGVRLEALHPNTPATVRENVAAQIFSFPVRLNLEEQRRLVSIQAILQGNAASGKHDADAQHVFEAAKYGGGYFLTHDQRINKTKRKELEKVLPPSLWIVTLVEFLAIYDRYEREWPE